MNSIFRHASILLSLMIAFLATVACPGQTVPDLIADEPEYVKLDERKMRAVVGKILAAEFGRKKGPKRMEVYDPDDGGTGFSDLDEAWLPKLSGINFSIVSTAELQRRGRSGKIDVYFFTKPKIVEGRYQIGFGSENPFCTYTGGDWTFNMIGAISVVRMNSGFGAGCCNGSGN